MVKPLAFKGDKRPKKRKRAVDTNDDAEDPKFKELAVTDAAAAEDDSWVLAETAADIAGPVVIVLPTEPATCLACDANGKIFSSVVENIVERDPTTVEPSDVRQVWIANRAAGTESFSFKGHHGRYLSCDKFGILSATSEAISPAESFFCIPTPGGLGTVNIQTQRDTFLTVDDDVKGPAEVRGDADSVGFSTTFRIRMQARFKPRLKASKEEKARERISKKALEEAVGRRLEDEEIKKLKKARREGNYHETLLDVKVKGKHDKFA